MWASGLIVNHVSWHDTHCVQNTSEVWERKFVFKRKELNSCMIFGILYKLTCDEPWSKTSMEFYGNGKKVFSDFKYLRRDLWTFLFYSRERKIQVLFPGAGSTFYHFFRLTLNLNFDCCWIKFSRNILYSEFKVLQEF